MSCVNNSKKQSEVASMKGAYIVLMVFITMMFWIALLRLEFSYPALGGWLVVVIAVWFVLMSKMKLL